MSILSHLNKLEESNIFKLVYNGKVLGLRVKYYTVESGDYQYFDFQTSYVKRKDLREYLNSHSKEFQSLELIPYKDIVCTQDEIDKKIVVYEFKDENSAEQVLESVIKVLKQI